jgi:hypothetical protein
MKSSSAIRTGVALAATVGVAYSACTLVFWAWPETAAIFMNTLFHGLDFRKLQSGATLFSFGSFFYALVVMVVWAFVLGSLFGWIQGAWTRGDGPVR